MWQTGSADHRGFPAHHAAEARGGFHIHAVADGQVMGASETAVLGKEFLQGQSGFEPAVYASAEAVLSAYLQHPGRGDDHPIGSLLQRFQGKQIDKEEISSLEAPGYIYRIGRIAPLVVHLPKMSFAGGELPVHLSHAAQEDGAVLPVRTKHLAEAGIRISGGERSDQRRGRMLSVVDLIEAGTLTESLAAWLLVRILLGSSWLVGARPGGAGKTAVMSALLAMAPREARVWLSNRGIGWRQCRPGDTIVSYELSPGFYDAYIWGPDVVRLTELGRAGCRIVSNLHADELQEARMQVQGRRKRDFRPFRSSFPSYFGDLLSPVLRL